MKKRRLLSIIIFLIIVKITFTQALDINSNERLDDKNNSILKIKKKEISPNDISINIKNVKNKIKSKKIVDIKSFKSDCNQTHPALDIDKNEKILAAYEDSRINDIAWTYLSKEGAYIDGIFFGLEGMIKYPAIDYWGSDKRFFGTAIPSLDFYNGGVLPIFECSDVTDVSTYSLECVDWRSSGFSQIKDTDIACDNSKNKWEFGTISLIANKDSEINNSPCVCYMDPNNSGEIHINWYSEYDNCHHTMCDIDPVNHISYSIYDSLMINDQNYKLLLRYDDFGNWISGEHGIIEISIEGIDLKYPTIAVNNNNIMILSVAINENLKDIICIYSLEGIKGEFHTTFVANSFSCENFPKVTHILKNKFICTFLKNENYYISRTEDCGKTWKLSRQINNKNISALEGYKKTDLCERANYTLCESKSGESIELFFADCLHPVKVPSKPYGPKGYGCTSTCMCCEQYTGYYGGEYSTTGTDPFAYKLKYKFHWGNGQGYSDWTKYYEPGVECDPLWVCYYFGGPGTKTIEISVKAMDENGYESLWSKPLKVDLVWAGGFRKMVQPQVKYWYKGIDFIQSIFAYYYTLNKSY